MSTVVEENRIDLIVFGYTRQKYHCADPVALVSIVREFYNLWKQHHFTETEIKNLMELPEEDSMSIHLDTLVINSSAITIVLQVNSGLESCLQLKLPADIVQINGFIGGHFNEVQDAHNLNRLEWRNSSESNTSHGIFSRSAFWERSIKSPLSFYVDILQIKYTLLSQRINYDGTPQLNIQRLENHRWDIVGDSLPTLQTKWQSYHYETYFCERTDFESATDGNWELRLRIWKEHWQKPDFTLDIHYNKTKAYPLDASSFTISVRISATINDKHFQQKETINLHGSRTKTLYLIWDAQQVWSATSITVDVEIEIIDVKDEDDEAIHKEDWY